MKSKINVITIKQAPVLKQPLIQCGVRDKTAAEQWAVKNGFATVYFLERKQKVYGERLRTDVAEVAQQIEQASADLVEMAEAAL